MNSFFKKIILLALISLFLFPAAALADGTYNGSDGIVEYEGLVPCGGEKVPCHFCHIFVLLNEVLNFIWFTIVPPLAVLLGMIAGFYFIFSGGDPKKIEKARGIGISLVIGLFLIYGSWIIVNVFFTVFDVKDWTGLGSGGWSEVNCEIGDSSEDFQTSCSFVPTAAECSNRGDCEYITSGDKCRTKCSFIRRKGECIGRSDCYWEEEGEEDGLCKFKPEDEESEDN